MKISNKKSFFKFFGATTLATLIATAGVFAFAPMTANAKVINTNQEEITESAGLISPKEDDPVLFTTESGLEIKAGNALTGVFAGYPYFTTNDGTKDYYWVIIGVAPNLANFFSTTQASHTIGIWENSGTTKAEYYKTNIKESSDAGTTVHGSNIIGGVVQDAECTETYSITKIPKSNDEIPLGCCLVLARTEIGGAYTKGYTDVFPNKWNTSLVKKRFDGFYNNGELGLDTIKSQIRYTSLNTLDVASSTSTAVVTSSSYLFILAGNESSSFYAMNYFNGKAYDTTGYIYEWMRGAYPSYDIYSSGNYYNSVAYTNQSASTSLNATYATYNSAYARPAFIMSL